MAGDDYHIMAPTLASALGLTDSPRVVTTSVPPYTVVHTNRAWSEATGYRFLEVVGKTCDVLQGPETEQGAVEVLRSALKSGNPATVVLINYRKDGIPFRNMLHCELVEGGSHWVGTLMVNSAVPNVARLPRTAEELAPPVPLAPVNYAKAAHSQPRKRPRRADKQRLKDVLANTTEPIVLCAKEFPHVITHANQPWLEMCGYTQEEVEGLTNEILTGPETDPAAIRDLLDCVRRCEPSHQTLINYKKGGVRFVNEVRTLPVYDEQDELAAFMSMLSEVDESDIGAADLCPGHAHLWAALQLRFEANSISGAAQEEAARRLLSNHEAILADMTSLPPYKTQPGVRRVPPTERPYADQALREVCRRLMGCAFGSSPGRGVIDERLEAAHPLRPAQQEAWAVAADFLDARIQSEPMASGREADMSAAAAEALRSVLQELRKEACA